MDTKVIEIKWMEKESRESGFEADARESDPKRKEEAEIKNAGRIIRDGGLVAFPTETVYGLGGDGLNPSSSKKIYAAKGRPSDNPLIVHISKWESLEKIAKEVPQEAKVLADAFWPGPLTMILKKKACVPKETTGGLDTVAVRMPAHPVALAFIEEAGGFVAAPSANTSGKPSPTLAKHVREDMMGRIDMIIDGGEVGIGVESTIVDLTGETPMILRPGYVTEEMLQRVLGEVTTDKALLNPDSEEKPKAPGMKYRHYAPKGKMVLVEGEPCRIAEIINQGVEKSAREGERTGVLCSEELYDLVTADVKKCVGKRENQSEIAHNLYRVLREFDEEDVTMIYAESFSDKDFGQAVMNRLLKAAGYTIIRE